MLAGDFLLGYACATLSWLGKSEVVESMATVIANLVKGESYQIAHEGLGVGMGRVWSEDWCMYLHMSYLMKERAGNNSPGRRQRRRGVEGSGIYIRSPHISGVSMLGLLPRELNSHCHFRLQFWGRPHIACISAMILEFLGMLCSQPLAFIPYFLVKYVRQNRTRVCGKNTAVIVLVVPSPHSTDILVVTSFWEALLLLVNEANRRKYLHLFLARCWKERGRSFAAPEWQMRRKKTADAIEI